MRAASVCRQVVTSVVAFTARTSVLLVAVLFLPCSVVVDVLVLSMLHNTAN